MRRITLLLTAMTWGLAAMLGEGVARADVVAQAGGEAFAAFQQEDFIRARERAERQWELAEAQADRFQAGLAAANLAATLAIAGQVDEALEWYETAESRLRSIGRSREVGRIAVARGLALYMKRESKLGDRELARAGELLGVDDWRLEFVTTLLDIWTRLDLWQGQQSLEKLLERACDSRDSTRVAATLMALAWVEGATGSGEPALAHYEEAIGLFDKRGDAGSAALARRNMGVVHLRAGEPDRAAGQLRKALALAREAGEPRLEFRALTDQAEATLAGLVEDLRQGRLLDTPLVDYYDLLRMRYLNPPGFQIDGFPWLFDQLALSPEGSDESSGER